MAGFRGDPGRSLSGLGASRSNFGGRIAPELVPPPTPGGENNARGGLCPRASYGAACMTNIGKGTDNQDTFVTSSNESGTKCFIGVFDGHGERGGDMSDFAKHCLTKSFFGRKDFHSDPKGALEAAYRETQGQIEARHGSAAEFSGTTAVSAYQYRDRLYVANVGDSRAVLGRCPTARADGQPSSLKAVDLSSDQKPDRSDERQRIVEQGGIVQQGAFPIHGPMGIRMVRMGPERVMDHNGLGGLAMSRSLGDLRLRPYVSSLPEVHERQLCSKDKVLILGTDGVWDHVSSQEAVDIAGRNRDPQQAAREIINVARRRWQTETQGQVSDDITAVVVNLDHSSGVGGGRVSESPAGTSRSSSRPEVGSRSLRPEAVSRGALADNAGLFRQGQGDRQSISAPSVGLGQTQRRRSDRRGGQDRPRHEDGPLVLPTPAGVRSRRAAGAPSSRPEASRESGREGLARTLSGPSSPWPPRSYSAVGRVH